METPFSRLRLVLNQNIGVPIVFSLTQEFLITYNALHNRAQLFRIVLAHIKRDGSVSTPTFWNMLLQGHTLMAFNTIAGLPDASGAHH